MKDSVLSDRHGHTLTERYDSNCVKEANSLTIVTVKIYMGKANSDNDTGRRATSLWMLHSITRGDTCAHKPVTETSGGCVCVQ